MSFAHRSSVALIVLFAVGTSSAHADWLGFRNDLTHAVLLESTRQMKGTIHSTPPQFLYPGETLWHRVGEASTRRITVFDARGARPMLIRFEARPENLYVIESKKEAGGIAFRARLVPARKEDVRTSEATARKD